MMNVQVVEMANGLNLIEDTFAKIVESLKVKKPTEI